MCLLVWDSAYTCGILTPLCGTVICMQSWAALRTTVSQRWRLEAQLRPEETPESKLFVDAVVENCDNCLGRECAVLLCLCLYLCLCVCTHHAHHAAH